MTGLPFTADLDELERTIGAMTRCDTDLGALLDEVEERVAALHLTWEGEAAAAHLVAQRAWRDGYREMAEALGAIRRVAQVAHGNYDAAVRANVAMWGRVR